MAFFLFVLRFAAWGGVAGRPFIPWRGSLLAAALDFPWPGDLPGHV
jgi:hypothetical protein